MKVVSVTAAAALTLTIVLFTSSSSSSMTVVLALPSYRDLIPNGRAVPHPDIPGAVWSGVGHFNVGGGGPRNPFGLDFAAAGYQWTSELCQQDSDGDGRSNGIELGDPNCVWEQGQDPDGLALSHPGIVDDNNKNNSSLSDTCADYVAPDDQIVYDITFTNPNTLDGSKRTEYICEQREIDAPLAYKTYYHQIRQEVLLDSDALHHIWIYICPTGVDSSDGKKVGQGPYDCNGIEGNCQIVSGWAVGMGPTCEPQFVGAGVDFNSYSFGQDYGKAVVKIEAHYDNANLQPGTDQSGMRMFLTPTVRPLEAGQVILGMDYWDRQFELPTGQPEVIRSNVCPSVATQQALWKPIYVYSWNPHMHLYGRRLVTEHYRCGQKIGEIGNMPSFEFDNQQSYSLPHPIKVLPGDALVTTCVYDTSTAPGNVVLGGEETTDEMCDNYLNYYPSALTENSPNLFTMCVSYEQGLNPSFAGFDDTSPFAVLDLSGEIWLDSFTSLDPTSTDDLPACCMGGAEACEQQYLARANGACSIDADCVGTLFCSGGLCSISGQRKDEEGSTNNGEDDTNKSSPSAARQDTFVLLASGLFIVANLVQMVYQ